MKIQSSSVVDSWDASAAHLLPDCSGMIQSHYSRAEESRSLLMRGIWKSLILERFSFVTKHPENISLLLRSKWLRARPPQRTFAPVSREPSDIVGVRLVLVRVPRQPEQQDTTRSVRPSTGSPTVLCQRCGRAAVRASDDGLALCEQCTETLGPAYY